MSVDLSVIIPTFRRANELVEAISSALGQRGASVEVFVIDDCPDASAEEIVRRVGDPRVVYLKNPDPSGGFPSVVRNVGWPLARGTYVHFLDDDDLVAQGYYAAAKATLEANPLIGLVFGQIEPFGVGPAAQLEHERRYFAEAAAKAAVSSRFGARYAFVGRMLFDNALLVCSSSVIRRECLVELNGFDSSIRLKEDVDFHVRAMRKCGAIFLERMAIRYRIGGPSLMHSPNPTEAQKREERLGHKKMQTKYRKQHGALEYYALAVFTRTILKLL